MELADLKVDLEASYPVSVRYRSWQWGNFTGGSGEAAVIAFIFGAIASGFFREIGKDLWFKAKEACKRIYDSHKRRCDDSRMTVLVAFEYKGYQVTGVLEVDRDTRMRLETLYRGDPVGGFWDDLPNQVETVVRIIDDGNADLDGVSALGLTLDTTDAKWVLERYEQKMKLEDYLPEAPSGYTYPGDDFGTASNKRKRGPESKK